MRVIHRKLIRELWQTRWQVLAIVLVMASGVAMVVMSVSTLQSLQRTRAGFYAESRFGDAFAQLKRAPLAMVERIRELPGVAAVEVRVAVAVTIDVAGFTEPATGRLISLPEEGEPAVNRIHLRAGRNLTPYRRGEILISEAFANAHRLQPGDALHAVINGKQQRCQIVGIVLSPEHVYSVRPGELLPDDRRFGVLWMHYDELAAAFDMDGAFNDVSVAFAPGASEVEVLRSIDRLLAPYGGIDAYGRDRQPSHRFLENELIQLRTMALLPPVIFLSVTAFLLHVVMSRIVAIQREQIAAMRAFGYTRREVAMHFFAFAIVISVLGTSLGIALGAWLGYDLTGLYAAFFRFPVFHYRLDPLLAIAASVVSFASALGGVWRSVWFAANEPPAQAMQPRPPARYRPSLLESLGLQRYFPQIVRMILRHLERRPIQALLTSVGIAMSVAMLVMGNFMEDTVDHVMTFQFFQVHRQDMMVAFVEPTTGKVVHDIEHLPGVLAVEPFRAVPVRVTHQHHQRRLDLLGLSTTPQLMRVVDAHSGPVELPKEGIIISKRLAEILHCNVGDALRVEVLESRRPVEMLTVTRLLDDYLDLNAYVSTEVVHRIMQEQDTVSGVFLTADGQTVDQLFEKLKATPRVAGVNIKRAGIESYRKTMAENLLRMKAMTVIFASIVACGVVYNCARISLAERSRELGTLRVLGFTRGETAMVLLGELAVLLAVAIPIGLTMGYLLSWLLTLSLSTEVHRFPVIIQGRTYAFAIVVTILAALASAFIVRRRMDRFNIVEVLKARD